MFASVIKFEKGSKDMKKIDAIKYLFVEPPIDFRICMVLIRLMHTV